MPVKRIETWLIFLFSIMVLSFVYSVLAWPKDFRKGVQSRLNTFEDRIRIIEEKETEQFLHIDLINDFLTKIKGTIEEMRDRSNKGTLKPK